VGLGGLTCEATAALPDNRDDTNPVYRGWVTEVLRAHFPEDKQPVEDDPEWRAQQQRFFEAQLVWDETMAANAVRGWQSLNPDAAFVVVAGAGHVRNGWGIPDRVAREVDAELLLVVCAVITGESNLEETVDPRAADYYCLTRDRSASSTRR